MKSLRTRLLSGLAVLIVASGVGAGVWAFRWSFDEAIELQDAILLQIGALVARNQVQAELPAQPGVDAEARVIIKQIPDRSVGAESDIDYPRVPIELGDGLHTLGSRGRALACFGAHAPGWKPGGNRTAHCCARRICWRQRHTRCIATVNAYTLPDAGCGRRDSLQFSTRRRFSQAT
jgi:hypothetical protein